MVTSIGENKLFFLMLRWNNLVFHIKCGVSMFLEDALYQFEEVLFYS